jgi:large-conductance mechanosensitive channel
MNSEFDHDRDQELKFQLGCLVSTVVFFLILAWLVWLYIRPAGQ